MLIKESGEKFKVHGNRGKKDTPEILERGSYTAAYEVPTGVSIILACHNGLCRKNHVNVLLLTPEMIIKAV